MALLKSMFPYSYGFINPGDFRCKGGWWDGDLATVSVRQICNFVSLFREISQSFPTLGLPTMPPHRSPAPHLSLNKKKIPIPSFWEWRCGRFAPLDTPCLRCQHIPSQGLLWCSGSRQRAGTVCGKWGERRGCWALIPPDPLTAL